MNKYTDTDTIIYDSHSIQFDYIHFCRLESYYVLVFMIELCLVYSNMTTVSS